MKGGLVFMYSPCLRLGQCLRAGRGRSSVMGRALKAGVIQDDDGRKYRLSYIYIMNLGTSEVLNLFLNIKC